MTPTVLEDKNSIIVIGTPGSRIISIVAQYLAHYLFSRLIIKKIINICHHQYYPNKVF